MRPSGAGRSSVAPSAVPGGVPPVTPSVGPCAAPSVFGGPSAAFGAGATAYVSTDQSE